MAGPTGHALRSRRVAEGRRRRRRYVAPRAPKPARDRPGDDVARRAGQPGLFLHSLQQMQNAGARVQARTLLMMSVDLGLQQYSDSAGPPIRRGTADAAEALPGVDLATVVQPRSVRLWDAVHRRGDRRSHSRLEGRLRLHAPSTSLVRGSSRRPAQCCMQRPRLDDARRRTVAARGRRQRDDGAQAVAVRATRSDSGSASAGTEHGSKSSASPRRQVRDARGGDAGRTSICRSRSSIARR